MKGIADTGFIVAVGSQVTTHHDVGARFRASDITEPLLTCESVLAEAAFHLVEFLRVVPVEDGLLRVAFDFSENIGQLRELARRYADRKPDLADLCLIRMSELHPRHAVITVDEADFRVYRRNKRETIPLICPPQGN